MPFTCRYSWELVVLISVLTCYHCDVDQIALTRGLTVLEHDAFEAEVVRLNVGGEVVS